MVAGRRLARHEIFMVQPAQNRRPDDSTTFGEVMADWYRPDPLG